MINALKIPTDVTNKVNKLLKQMGLLNALLPSTSNEMVQELTGKTKSEIWACNDDFKPTITLEDIPIMDYKEQSQVFDMIKGAKLYYGYMNNETVYEVIIASDNTRIGIPLSFDKELMNLIFLFLKKI